jgi:hypothetical protein
MDKAGFSGLHASRMNVKKLLNTWVLSVKYPRLKCGFGHLFLREVKTKCAVLT